MSVVEYLKMGYEFIGHETVTASDPPTAIGITVPSTIRKVVMICHNVDALENLVFGAVSDENSVTAVEIPYCHNEVPTIIGPIDATQMPYYLYCTVDTDVRVTMLGTEMGDMEAVSVR